MNRKSLQEPLHKHPSVGKHPDRLAHPALVAGRDRHAEEPSEQRAGGFSAFCRGIIRPMAVAAAAGLAAVTALAGFAYGNADPTALIPALSAAAVAVASLAGGLTAGLGRRRQALGASLIVGLILSALLCLGGLWAGGGTPLAWLTRLLPLPVCAVSGLLTRARPQKAAHAAHR